MQAIDLIYGARASKDVQFCVKHNRAILRYAHGIMTMQGAPRDAIEAVANRPESVHGWMHLLAQHPEDVKVLREFLKRLIAHYDDVGRWQ